MTHKSITKKDFIKFIKSIGIKINTNTKARGHNGIYFKNRIDVSKNLSEEKQICVMAHEFAHYIHSKLEKDITKGHLEILFCTSDTEQINEELIELTLQIDENARLKKLFSIKEQLVLKIKYEEQVIKNDFPNFKKSEKFKEFEKYIKKSDARYLLKYDRIRLIQPFWRKEKFYSIDNVKEDFPDMPCAFCAYLRLNSLQKKRKRITAKITKYRKYYESPSELFARFIESFFIDEKITDKYAPKTKKIFFDLLKHNYYFELYELFNIAKIYNHV